jgi:hypothetical protein
MTQAEFNSWIRARFNLWTKADVDAEVRKEREACAKLCEDYMKETAIMEARGCLASVAYDIIARGEQA